ncbi:hemerythrin domain-containing protein [Nitrogeniibacter aestuarii]|uniref:hemerythrin domain-containing protein n=1 Tax=Nitrogeniibacter aestuarii TaxID=2815343 RepID=UPI001D10FFE4|nr:hypothetical protein [Nitrogeniibacter aestuarii]
MSFIRQFQPPAVPRHDIYVGIHKGLRAFMADTLLRFGRLDPDDAVELAESLDALTVLLDLCAAHLVHENQVIHPALNAAAPGASDAACDDHVDHEHAIARLRQLAVQVRSSAPVERPERVLRLYRVLSCFVGDNLLHMHLEECEHNACLWRAYDDAEIQALEERIVASLSPTELMQSLRWMIPAMSPRERLELLGPMAAAMPPAVFDQVYAMVRRYLSAKDLAKLDRGLKCAA